MKKYLSCLPGLFVLLIFLSGCTALKPYERVYVNDPEMMMISSSDRYFEEYVESIREASIPAGGQKGSGGCGCN